MEDGWAVCGTLRLRSEAGFEAVPIQISFGPTHYLTFNKRSDAEKKAYWDWQHSQH
ncbi:MAG: hypothetical protein ABSA42_00410 [Terracidiphilus sp.]